MPRKLLALVIIAMLPFSPMMAEAQDKDSPAASGSLPSSTLSGSNSGSTGGYVMGATLYVLKPFFENNTAFQTTTAAGSLASRTPFSWNYDPAPAIWFGHVDDNGYGWRIRFFHFDQNSETARTTNAGPNLVTAPTSLTPPLPAPASVTGFGSPGIVGTAGGTDFLSFSSGLEIDSLDVEATYAWIVGDFSLLLSGGLRYLRLEQNYAGLLTSAIPGATEVQRLDFHNQFNGGGPTVAVQGRWDASVTGWSWFGLIRGGLLVGQANRLTAFTQSVDNPGGTVGGSFTFASQVRDDATEVIPVAELELGAEYGWLRDMRYLCRGAVVNQTYFNAGNASGQSGALSLFGLQLSLGVNY